MARTYPVLLTVKRLVLCIILIWAQDQYFIYRVVSFSLIQIIYFTLFLVIRPFTQITNNLVETNNEFLLVYMVFMLSYYNKRDRWNYTIEKVFIHSITGSSACALLIFIIWFISSTAWKYIRRKSSKTQVKRFVNGEAIWNDLRRRNDTLMVSFDHHRTNAPISQTFSRVGSKLPMNTDC